MAWGYLARAYAIKEFALMKETEADNGDEIDESIDAVRDDIEIILEMAEDNLYDDYQYNYRTIKQCKKWLEDF